VTEGRLPAWMPPMLASTTDRRVFGEEWVFERKYDGERCLAFRQGGAVRLLTRNRKAMDEQYPELVAAILLQDADGFVVDGEVVAFEGRRTSFARLQRRMHERGPSLDLIERFPVFLYVFDILYLDGQDVRSLPLLDRKALLRRSLSFIGPLRYAFHRSGDADDLLAEACRRGWEGVIAKRADARYVGGRSGEWLKLKCVLGQEFVVGGFTDPRGTRAGLGALVLGVYEGDRLVYAGRVGTGFDEASLGELRSRLEALESSESPFGGGSPPGRDLHWVRPEVVVQVGFAEWTSDGVLRHPRFLGLRDDKHPLEVRREDPLLPPQGVS
jgi:bifunctional non-homologous end joining protein LigD